MNLFEQQVKPNWKPKPKRGTTAFIFDFDVDEQEFTVVGVIRDIRLRDSRGWLHEWELREAGWESFVERRGEYALQVSGRYRWEGTYWSHCDYYGEWDCGWDVVSLEPANRKTRKAVAAYWDQLGEAEICGHCGVDTSRGAYCAAGCICISCAL